MAKAKVKIKLKSIRGAAKRFKKTGSGKVVHKQAHRRHILTKKSVKRKRQLRGNSVLATIGDRKAVERMLADR